MKRNYTDPTANAIRVRADGTFQLESLKAHAVSLIPKSERGFPVWCQVDYGAPFLVESSEAIRQAGSYNTLTVSTKPSGGRPGDEWVAEVFAEPADIPAPRPLTDDRGVLRTAPGGGRVLFSYDYQANLQELRAAFQYTDGGRLDPRHVVVRPEGGFLVVDPNQKAPEGFDLSGFTRVQFTVEALVKDGNFNNPFAGCTVTAIYATSAPGGGFIDPTEVAELTLNLNTTSVSKVVHLGGANRAPTPGSSTGPLPVLGHFGFYLEGVFADMQRNDGEYTLRFSAVGA